MGEGRIIIQALAINGCDLYEKVFEGIETPDRRGSTT